MLHINIDNVNYTALYLSRINNCGGIYPIKKIQSPVSNNDFIPTLHKRFT